MRSVDAPAAAQDRCADVDEDECVGSGCVQTSICEPKDPVDDAGILAQMTCGLLSEVGVAGLPLLLCCVHGGQGGGGALIAVPVYCSGWQLCQGRGWDACGTRENGCCTAVLQDDCEAVSNCLWTPSAVLKAQTASRCELAYNMAAAHFVAAKANSDNAAGQAVATVAGKFCDMMGIATSDSESSTAGQQLHALLCAKLGVVLL